MKTAKIQLSPKQIGYIKAKVNMQEQQPAIEYFAEIMRLEGIDPRRMSIYTTLMMRKDGIEDV